MTDSGNYAARATALRETAKWIAAVFAGTGAILFSGLSFTNIEKIASVGSWQIPVVLAIVPLLAAALAVRTAATVISVDPPATAQLLPRLAPAVGASAAPSPLRAGIESLVPATVATYGSIDGFEDRLVTVHQRVAAAQLLFTSQATAANREALEAEFQKLAALQEGVRDLVLCADFIQVKQRYDRARWVLLGAALVGVGAAAASGVVAAQQARAHAAKSDGRPSALTIREPTSVRVYPQKGPTPCPLDIGASATAIGGTLLRPLLLFEATSPERRTKTTAARCLRPWTWSAPKGRVVVVPEIHSIAPAHD